MELKIAPTTIEISRGFLASVFRCQNISVQRHDYYFRCLVLKYHWSGSGQHSITEDRGKEKTQPEKERQKGCVYIYKQAKPATCLGTSHPLLEVPNSQMNKSQLHLLLIKGEHRSTTTWRLVLFTQVFYHSIPRILPLLFSALPG